MNARHGFWKDWPSWIMAAIVTLIFQYANSFVRQQISGVNISGLAKNLSSFLLLVAFLIAYSYGLRAMWSRRSSQPKTLDKKMQGLKDELRLIMRRLEPLFDFSFSHSFFTVFSQANMDFEKDRVFALANWFAFFRTQFQRSHDLQSGIGYFLSLVVRQAEEIYQSFHKRYQGGTTKEQKDLVRDYNTIIGDLKAWLEKASDSFEVPVHRINYIEEPDNL